MKNNDKTPSAQSEGSQAWEKELGGEYSFDCIWQDQNRHFGLAKYKQFLSHSGPSPP